MSRKGARNQRLRRSLWAQNPNCTYCGIPTVLPESLNLRVGDKEPDNMATLDHLYSRWHPQRRQAPQKGEHRKALSCRRCNIDRGREEEKKALELAALVNAAVKKKENE